MIFIMIYSRIKIRVCDVYYLLQRVVLNDAFISTDLFRDPLHCLVVLQFIAGS